MLTIYGVFRSRATRNLWLADELGLTYKHVPVIQGYRLPDPQARDAPFNTASADFTSLSPAGAIPVIDDDGFILSESLAINHYLARKHGGPLAPADLHEEAEMLQWSLYGATSLEADALQILYIFAQKRHETPQGRAELDQHSTSLRRPLAVLNAHLSSHGHMVGNRFTLADINCAEIMRFAQPHAALLQDYPAILGWLDRCQSRPAFKKIMDLRAAEPL